MTNSGTGTTIAGTFADRSVAEACVRELRAAGLPGAWLTAANTGAEAPATASEASPGATDASQAAESHAVAESSDGVIGTIGRYLRGDPSLRNSLVEHGMREPDARDIDASLTPRGAVVVVRAGDRVDEAASIVSRGAMRVFGAEGERFARYPSTTDTVPGQGDELDRGTDRNRSGGGLGATTGFWRESDAREDLHASGVGELDDSRADGERR